MNITDGTLQRSIYGGYSVSDATGNIINFGGTRPSYPYAYSTIYGGYSTSGIAQNNEVNITGGIVGYQGTSGGVYGGYSYSSNATNNTVKITDGTVVNIHGGSSGNSDATTNTVTIDGGVIGGSIYGGNSAYGNATGNTVNINGGTFGNSTIYGGYSNFGNADSNTINITGGDTSDTTSDSILIYGGYSGYANNGKSANDNIINISGNPNLTKAAIYGSTAFDSSGNTLNIYTKDLTAQNIGGFNNINFYLGSNISNGDTILTLNDVSGNQTYVKDADIKAVMQSGSPLTNGDTVTLLTNASGVTAAKSYTGTAAEGVSLTYPLTVYRNDEGTAILARLGEDSGGGSDSGGESSGGESSSGESSSGESSGGESSGGESSSGDDSNNVKNIYSTDGGTIYGGYTETGNAQNNTINLYSGTFDNIYGGYAPAGSTSGNILNVRNKNISAQNLSNFSAMNFYIPNDAANGDTMLTLTDSSGTDLSGVAINAGVVAGNSNLAVGDTINLLTNSNGLTASGTTYGTLSEGVSLLYGVNVAQAGNSVVANITSVPTINETTKKIINDTPARDLVIIQPSNNFPGFNNGDFPEEDDNGGIIYPDLPNNGIVFNIGGGSMRTKTGNGSYVDSKTVNIDLGWERTISSGSAGSFTFAPIIDYAHSNNDTYLADGTHGTGSTKYVAGGGAFRKTWNSGFYLEGSARFGKVKSDFQSNDMDKVGGQTVSYSTDANTISGHLGIGRNWRMNKNNLLHVYATYYHAHQGSMHTKLAPYGDEYDISSANSGRFKFGYRMTTRTSKISRIYTGLAYQYEHISGVDSTYLAKNISTSSESISGSSGMLEIGWLIKPLQNNPWEVNINATGWVGHQRGVTAFAKVQKAF